MARLPVDEEGRANMEELAPGESGLDHTGGGRKRP